MSHPTPRDGSTPEQEPAADVQPEDGSAPAGGTPSDRTSASTKHEDSSVPDDAPIDPADGDGTQRLQADGTIGSARPGNPAPPTAPRVSTVRPGTAVPPVQPLPLSPRRRARDEPAAPPVPVEQLPTSELPASRGEAATGAGPTDSAAATPTPVPARPGGPSTPPRDDDDDDDDDQTVVVPAAVVPAGLFDDAPRPAADPATGPEDTTALPPSTEPAPTALVPAQDDATDLRQGPTDRADRDRTDPAQDDASGDDATTVVPTAAAAPPFPPAHDDRPTDRDDQGDDHSDDHPAGDGGSRAWWRKPAVLAPVGLLVALGVAYSADLLVAGDDVPRNTVVAGVGIGGLSPEAAATALAEDLAPQVTADHVIVADDVQGTLSPATAGITLDVEATVDAAGGQPLNPWTRLTSLFDDRQVAPVITGDETALDAQLEQFAEGVDRAPSDATIAVEGASASVVPAVIGRVLDREGAAEAITVGLSSGGDPATPIELPVDTTDVLVDEGAAQQALDETVTPALSDPVTVVSDDRATSVDVGVEAVAASLLFTGQEDGSLAVTLDPAALQAALGDELGGFGTPAQDADFQVAGDAIAVVPSVDGTGIDPTALAEQLLPALTQPAPRQVIASLGPVPADFTTDEAGALGITEQISTFTTNFTNSASGTNIRVVAAEVDGAVVLPGETFSLNGYTGPRTEAEGYVPAGIINNGEFTQAVGGGVSQFATTMFNAVFFAGLEDVFHKPHSYYISRYPAGREATVFYDSIDLAWLNDSPTGVYVQAVWQPGALTVTFWGTRRYEIESVSSERFNVRTPVVQEKPDDGDCSPQGGANGFDITVTRIFIDPASGQQLRTEDFRARYAAEPVIRCIPIPAPAAPESAAPAAPAAPARPAGRRPIRVRTARSSA